MPLGCLDMSIGYTDMICVTHLSVMVLSVLFCLGDQQQGLNSLIWKTLLIGEGPGFLSLLWRWETKQFWLAPSLDSEGAVSPPASLWMSIAGLHSLQLSLFCNSSNTSRVFPFPTVSPFLRNLQWQFLELRQQVLCGWWVFLPWHHLPVGSHSCFETTAVVRLLGVLLRFSLQRKLI